MRPLPLALFALELGCGGTTPPPSDTRPDPGTAGPATAAPAPPSPEDDPLAGRAHVRFLHAAAGAAATTLSGFAADTTTPLFPRVPWKTASPYVEVATSAGGVALAVRGEGITETTAQANVAPGTHQTVVVLTDAEDASKLQLVAIADDAPRPGGETVRVRFFHALVGASAVDVCVAGAGARAPPTLLFPGIGYGTLANYLDLPTPPPVRLQVRQAAEADCGGRLLGVLELSQPEGISFFAQNLTLFAIGTVRVPRGRPDVDREVFVSVDQPPMSEFLTLPLRAR